MFNILTEPIVETVMRNGDVAQVSLPETCAALMRDKVDAFPALRPHQRHAWHAFIVQLGAMALRHAELDELPDDADTWRDAMRALTPDFPDDEPWRLVVDDITKPAFMQPPASSADRLKDFKPKDDFYTPDALDMLVTSKAHDLKPAVAIDANLDDWLFALITLQTMEGYMGVGNYGIARMNGGASSRPSFSITPSERIGAHARRDIEILLPHHETVADRFRMVYDGVGLLWTEAWDGTKMEALNINRLDPFFIEVCRRVRLRVGADGKIYGSKANSKSERLNAKQLNGQTGDPWTPISRTGKTAKALTLSQSGFSYRRIAECMRPDQWSKPHLLKATPAELRSGKDMFLVARGMARGMGKTQGYFERVVPLRHKTTARIMSAAGERLLGDISKSRIDQIGKIQAALRHAISVYLAGGDNKAGDPRARVWANRLDEAVSASFFNDIQDEFEADSDDERDRIRDKVWGPKVYKTALDILRDAQAALPCKAVRRYRARVASDSVFRGRMMGENGFPEWVRESERRQ